MSQFIHTPAYRLGVTVREELAGMGSLIRFVSWGLTIGKVVSSHRPGRKLATPLFHHHLHFPPLLGFDPLGKRSVMVGISVDHTQAYQPPTGSDCWHVVR